MGGPTPPWPEPSPDDVDLGRARFFSLEVTTRCNLRCLHCYSAGEAGRDLPVDEVSRRLELARRAGAELVILTGGEPLVHERFGAVLDAASAQGLRTVMRCNGLCVDRAVARSLRRHGMPLVGVSIEGASAETNDRIRGPGHLDRAMEAVGHLKAEGIFVSLELTLHAGGAREVADVARLAREVGADAVIFRRVVAMGRAREHAELLPSPEELAEARSTIRRLDPEGRTLHIGCNLGGRCLAIDYFHVDLAGDVHPCYLVRERLCGIDELPSRTPSLLSDKGRHRFACLAAGRGRRAA